MTWKAYEIILRLRSPAHIGWRKVGNLQITRPYITGKVLWGALTMRLTRDQSDGSVGALKTYQKTGEKVNENLVFTYFYPALKTGDNYKVVWPWEDESNFRRRFLSSYVSTALAYPRQAADEGSLHEIEFISPNTLDTGEPVFLKGYVFEKDGSSLDWKPAVNRLQLGGERGYGWGDVRLEKEIRKLEDNKLFDNKATIKESERCKPVISMHNGSRILAHTLAEYMEADGAIEPFVGREWRSDNISRKYAGQHIEYHGLCFIPGCVIKQDYNFMAGDFGIWRKIYNRIKEI